MQQRGFQAVKRCFSEAKKFDGDLKSLCDSRWSLSELKLTHEPSSSSQVVSSATVDKLSRLALIDLSKQTDTSRNELEKDINTILNCATVLKNYASSSSSSLSSASAPVGAPVAEELTPGALRNDIAVPEHATPPEELFHNAQRVHGDFFVAPKD